jgi:hypothetical protein
VKRALGGAALTFVLGLGLGLFACPGPSREICGNGVDDDGNGLADCADPDCAGVDRCPAADAGWFGPCTKCGTTCTKQSQCLGQGYNYDAPLPWCVGGTCQALNTFATVNIEFSTAGWTGLTQPKTIAVRVISKHAQDGSAVTCSAVEAAAQGKTANDAAQIESTDRFQFLGFDVRPIQSSTAFAPNFTDPLVKMATGDSYLIWSEVWGGPPDSNTKLPTGNRMQWACDDSSGELGPIVASDTCDKTMNDAGTCRVFHLVMPGP